MVSVQTLIPYKKYLYAAALFHDFDPQKNVDKPHEESVIRFISLDKKLHEPYLSPSIFEPTPL